MVQITNGITVPMIRPRGIPRLRQWGGTPLVPQPLYLTTRYQSPPALQLQYVDPEAVQSVDHEGPPAQQLQSVDPEARQSVDYQAPPALQLQSVDPAALQSVDHQAPLAHQLQTVDPAAIQSVDQTDGNRNPGQSGGQTSSTSRNTDPDAPRSVTLRISAGTMFKALIGAIFTAAEAFMFYHLQQQGNSAPASSKIASTIVFVTLLLAFPFIATGLCIYKRSPFAADILGNAGFLCITLSFFAMMHVWVPKLVWLVWTVCGILLLVFAYFFAEDLKGFYAQRHKKMAAPIEV